MRLPARREKRMQTEIWVAIVMSAAGLITSIVTAYILLKKNRHEIEKIDNESEKMDAEKAKIKAETESIHQQVADRWAEHVDELMKRINKLETQRDVDRKEIAGLRMDITQVRRENEEYRSENTDLKDWVERLLRQFAKEAPHIVPEKFIRATSSPL